MEKNEKYQLENTNEIKQGHAEPGPMVIGAIIILTIILVKLLVYLLPRKKLKTSLACQNKYHIFFYFFHQSFKLGSLMFKEIYFWRHIIFFKVLIFNLLNIDKVF